MDAEKIAAGIISDLAVTLVCNGLMSKHDSQSIYFEGPVKRIAAAIRSAQADAFERATQIAEEHCGDLAVNIADRLREEAKKP